MRACVIFNPSARGDRARHFHQLLETISREAEVKPTLGPGSARMLARQAVLDGHPRIIAAGGDGTVFEVLNGIADAPDGLDRVVLGVLPLGTANVLASELGLASQPDRAWKQLQEGEVHRLDCGEAEFVSLGGNRDRAHFSVVAGAGLDARAVQLVDWSLKKRLGKLAYIAAAWRAFLRYPDDVECLTAHGSFSGRAVLVGNGRFYAGRVPVFGNGSMTSGVLQARIVKSITPELLVRCMLAYATGSASLERRLLACTATELTLQGRTQVPLQLDGERAGWLPATLRIRAGALAMLCPSGFMKGPASPVSRHPAA